MTFAVSVKCTPIKEPGLPNGGLFLLSIEGGYMIVRSPTTTSVATIEQWVLPKKDVQEAADVLVAKAVSVVRSSKQRVRIVVHSDQTSILQALYVNGFSLTLTSGTGREYTKQLV